MNYIFHHGIKGQKWGVRRYQNLDGTRTELGKLVTKGLAVVLDEGAKATRKNVERLVEHNKDVKVYELDKRSPNYDRWL